MTQRGHRRARGMLPALALVLGAATAPGLAQQPEWKPVPTYTERYAFQLAYDPLRERTVMFGGEHDRNDTWEWDGLRWDFRDPPHLPPARAFPGLVYDPVRQRILLFGGYSQWADQRFGDQWEWDGQDWRQVMPGAMPSARFGPVMGWDPARQVVVLFGGHVAPLAASDETWEWDGASWRLCNPTNRPRARYTTDLAYCPNTGRMVMVGGQVPGGAFLREGLTWEWDGAEWTSVASFPWPSPPSGGGLGWHGLATHPTRGTVIVHGFNGYLDRTWEYDGTAWTELGFGVAPVPPDFCYTKLALDWARQEIVAVAKPERWGSDHEVWTLGADLVWRRRWRQPPFQYQSAGFAHDGARDEFVLHVVKNAPSGLESQTGILRGSEYFLATPPHQPPPRYNPPMVWHGGLQKVVLYGDNHFGQRNDTWLWDGQDWTEHVSAVRPPAGTTVLAYDSHRDRIVAVVRSYGPLSTTLFDTWEWEPTGGWYAVATNTPQFLGRLTYDVDRRESLFFGEPNGPPLSGARTSETWTYDGITWRQHVTTTGPLSWFCIGPVYSAELGGVVCFDYDANWTFSYAGWRWTGSDWVGLPTVGIPSGEVKMYPEELLCDPGRGRLRLVLSTQYGAQMLPPPPQFFVHDLEYRTLQADQPNPHLGQSVTFTYQDAREAWNLWLFAVSENDWPGIPVKYVPYVGWRRLPIGDGVLLRAAGAVSQGFLNGQGRGSVTLPIPNVPALRDFEFTAVVATVGLSPLELRKISNPVHVEIVR